MKNLYILITIGVCSWCLYQQFKINKDMENLGGLVMFCAEKVFAHDQAIRTLGRYHYIYDKTN